MTDNYFVLEWVDNLRMHFQCSHRNRNRLDYDKKRHSVRYFHMHLDKGQHNDSAHKPYYLNSLRESYTQVGNSEVIQSNFQCKHKMASRHAAHILNLAHMETEHKDWRIQPTEYLVELMKNNSIEIVHDCLA